MTVVHIFVHIFQLMLQLVLLSFSVRMYLLSGVDFLRLLDLNDAVWLLNLVLKLLAVSPL